MIGASAVIIKDKKILLVKRSKNASHFPEHWGCPGGRGNVGETPEQVVIRELKEELGVVFKPTRLFDQSNLSDRETFRFLGTFSGKITLQMSELSEYRWFSYEEALQLSLAFDYRRILDKARQEKLI